MSVNQAWQDLLYPGNATDFFARARMPEFEPEATAYCRANALWLAELSRLVYRHDVQEDPPNPTPSLDTLLSGVNFKKLRFFMARATDTQAILVESTGASSYAVLAFRGTEQVLKDFASDLEIGKISISSSKTNVHEGFQKALDSVWNSIVVELNKLSANIPIFYTGHSLGAALATLAAARRPPKALYTFGSPRVGNKAFADSFPGIPIHRVVDDLDCITTLPPTFMGFQHVGIEHRLAAPKKEPLLKHLLDPPKPLADHAPINYVDRILSETT